MTAAARVAAWLGRSRGNPALRKLASGAVWKPQSFHVHGESGPLGPAELDRARR